MQITREEAKAILLNNTDVGYGVVIEGESTAQIKEALNMAIEALEIIKMLGESVDAYILGKKKEPKKGKWIPVSEGLPEDDTRVLITTTSALGTEHIVIEVSYLNGVFLRGFSSYTPSAWMPLPEAYKEERNANDS